LGGGQELGLEFLLRVSLKLQFPYLCLPVAGIIVVHHHIWLIG
jgi:hypothetical protein